MKAVVQRVSHARVLVEAEVRGSVGAGLLVYLGVARGDTEKDAAWLAEKIVNLRIFNDEAGKMNVSILEKKAACPDAAVLVVSQFTLLGECVKGRRPFFGGAAEPEAAQPLYEYVMERIREKGIRCESGVFGAHMQVESINDGPVTILLDSALAP